MLDGAGRQEQPLGDGRVPGAVGEEAQDVELPGCQGCRVGARRGVGPTRDADAELAQLACDDRGSRPRLQPLQLRQRLPQRLLLVGIGERERRLVRAPELRPLPRRLPPVAGELGCIRLGCARHLGVDAGSAPPDAELAEHAPVLLLLCQPKRVVGDPGNGLPVTQKPGDLGPCCDGLAHAEELVGWLGQRPGLVEELAMAGVAPSSADEAEHGQPRDARHDRRAPDPQDRGGRLGGLVPATLVELDQRVVAEEVEPVELDAVIAAVSEARIDVSGGEVVPPQRERSRDEAAARVPGKLCHTRSLGELEALLQLLTAVREVPPGDGRANPKDQLAVTEFLGEREGPVCKRPIVLHVGVRELAARRQRLEQRDRLPSRLRRVRRPSRTPEDLG